MGKFWDPQSLHLKNGSLLMKGVANLWVPDGQWL